MLHHLGGRKAREGKRKKEGPSSVSSVTTTYKEAPIPNALHVWALHQGLDLWQGGLCTIGSVLQGCKEEGKELKRENVRRCQQQFANKKAAREPSGTARRPCIPVACAWDAYDEAAVTAWRAPRVAVNMPKRLCLHWIILARKYKPLVCCRVARRVYSAHVCWSG